MPDAQRPGSRGTLLSLIRAAKDPVIGYMTAGLLGPRMTLSPVAPGMCELRIDISARWTHGGGSPSAFLRGENRRPHGPHGGMENLAGVTGGTRISRFTRRQYGPRALRAGDRLFLFSHHRWRVVRHRGPHGMDVKVARNATVRSRAMIYIKRPGVTVKPVTPEEMVKTAAISPICTCGSPASHRPMETARCRPWPPPNRWNPREIRDLVRGALRRHGDHGRAGHRERRRDSRDARAGGDGRVNSGTYRMRVAATDTAGRAGAADTNRLAEIVNAGPLKLSSLVLGVSREGKFLRGCSSAPNLSPLRSWTCSGQTWHRSAPSLKC